MTDVSRLSTLRYALHTDEYTFDDVPGTLFPLRTTDDGASLLPRQRAPLARNLRSLGGRRYSHIRGVQDTGDITIQTEFKGVNANTGAAVTDWEAKMEQGLILAAMFGAVAPATVSVAPTVAAAGHTPGSGILEVVGVTANVGDVIGFDTSAGFQVMKVATEVGTTLTGEHPYLGTPVTGATIYRAAVYSVDDTKTLHWHAYLSAEGEDWRRDYLGCAPMSFSLEMAGAGVIAMSSVWSPTTWTDTAEANPAHAEPTAGSPIVMDNATLWFGGYELLARDFSLTYSNAMQTRRADTEVNGKLGAVAAAPNAKEFRIEFSGYLGDGQLAGEIQDSTGTTPPSLAALLGVTDSAGDVSTTRELSLQVGTEVGATLYAHMGTADVVTTTQIVDGLTMFRCVCTGTGAVPGILAVL